MQRWGVCLILSQLIFACGQKLAGPSSNNNSSKTCTKAISPFATSKLQTEDRLPAGTELVALVDESCQTGEKHRGHRSREFHLNHDYHIDELKYEIAQDPCIIGVSNNLIFHTKVITNDPLYTQQSHLSYINLPRAADTYTPMLSSITTDVIIAIIDSGVDLNHPDLIDHIWVNPKEIANNSIDDDNNGFIDDVNGWNFPSRKADPRPEPWPAPDTGGEVHGTHVAGLAAARADNAIGGAGVMGAKVKIMALNIFGREVGASTVNIDNAIRYAADNGAKVVNLSLGACGAAATTAQAVQYAVNKGVTVVAAAGNEGRELSINVADAANCNRTTGKIFATPASYGGSITGLITVGSVDINANTRSSFSNYSVSVVKLFAPGSDSSKNPNGLLSTLPGTSYGRLQGTSMASPVVAGSAALLIGLASITRTLNPGLVESALMTGSMKRANLTTFSVMGNSLDLTMIPDLARGTIPIPAPTPPTPMPDACL